LAIALNQLSAVARDLGVLFDTEQSVRQHASRSSQTCFFICAVYAQVVVNLAVTLPPDCGAVASRLLQRYSGWFAGIYTGDVTDREQFLVDCAAQLAERLAGELTLSCARPAADG